MKNTHQNALEIAKRGGAIPSGDWTTGTGNFVSKRAIPELCHEIDADKVGSLKGRSKTAALRVLRNRPKVRKLIVVSDWRTLGKIIKQEGAK